MTALHQPAARVGAIATPEAARGEMRPPLGSLAERPGESGGSTDDDNDDCLSSGSSSVGGGGGDSASGAAAGRQQGGAWLGISGAGTGEQALGEQMGARSTSSNGAPPQLGTGALLFGDGSPLAAPASAAEAVVAGDVLFVQPGAGDPQPCAAYLPERWSAQWSAQFAAEQAAVQAELEGIQAGLKLQQGWTQADGAPLDGSWAGGRASEEDSRAEAAQYERVAALETAGENGKGAAPPPEAAGLPAQMAAQMAAALAAVTCGQGCRAEGGGDSL